MRGFRAEMGGQFWHEGQTERNGHVFRWEAKVYPEGSACGINGGRGSKLWIAELPPVRSGTGRKQPITTGGGAHCRPRRRRWTSWMNCWVASSELPQ